MNTHDNGGNTISLNRVAALVKIKENYLEDSRMFGPVLLSGQFEK